MSTSDPTTTPSPSGADADQPTVDRDRSDAGQVVADAAEVYETFFVPALFSDWPPILLDRAGVTDGNRILDVGCGTGVLARAAVEWVGAAGEVVGVDLNPGMLAVAGRAATEVTWRQGAAEELPFDDDSFDRVLSQFALMFFADRDAGVGEMARVARPGTPVTVATWATLDDTPGYAAMAALLDRLFGPEVASAIEAPYVLGRPDDVTDLLSTHLDGVTVEVVDGTARFPSIDDWVRTDIRGWTLADVLSDAQFDVLIAEARRDLARFADDDGRVRFTAPAVVATGRARS
ncbi:MAG: methyltransferase domain-containing protein [Actinomycetota bacterium]